MKDADERFYKELEHESHLDYSAHHSSNEWKEESDSKYADNTPANLDAHTTFNPNESSWKSWDVNRSIGTGGIKFNGPDKIKYSEWLRQLNAGGFDGRKNRERQSRYDIKTIGSTLELTSHQLQRALYLRSQHSGQTGHVNGKDPEIITLAAITLAANEDNRPIRDEREFEKIQAALNVTDREIKQVRKQLHKFL